MVHGALDRATSFGRVRRHLRDLYTVAYDRRGYGHSAQVAVTDDVTRHVADLVDVLDGTPSVLIGHSYGGVVTLLAAQEFPRLVRSALVYEAPMPWTPWWSENGGGRHGLHRDPADVSEGFMRAVVGDRVWERLPPGTKAKRRAEGPALVADLRSLASDPGLDLAVISVPIVAAHGSASVGRHRRSAALIAADAPAGRLEILDGAAHGGHLSHPAEFAGLVRAVLSEA